MHKYPVIPALLILCPVLFSCSGGTDQTVSDGGNQGICHNGAIDPGEECDNQVVDSASCASLGFEDGDLECDDQCQFDTSGCTQLVTCGNGTLDTMEPCEGFELRNATCELEGFESGPLSCTSDCMIDTSNCVQFPQAACGGEVPDATGEFFFALAPSLSPKALLQFIATVLVDSSSEPATLTMSLQPLCTQSDQCTLGQPLGEAYMVSAVELGEQCLFSVNISGFGILGGANSISGSPFIADITMDGALQTETFFCGSANGDVLVGGSPIPIDGSTFGSRGIATGTLGGNLPSPISACP